MNTHTLLLKPTLKLPAFQEHEEFLAAVAFPPQDAGTVIASAGECFRTARSLAVDLLRRGDQLAAEAEVAAAAVASAADAVSRGRSGNRSYDGITCSSFFRFWSVLPWVTRDWSVERRTTKWCTIVPSLTQVQRAEPVSYTCHNISGPVSGGFIVAKEAPSTKQTLWW